MEKKKTHHQTPISSEADSQPLPNLPHEIIVEILSRLPVKSLLRFRSVCKSWLSLISDPQFAKTHLSLASESEDYTHQRLVLSCISSPVVNLMSMSTSLYSVLNEQFDTAVELDHPLKHSRDLVCIVGSCHGLVCIGSGEDDLFLWNPSTRISKRLPDSGDHMLCKPSFYTLCGFGYDESNDDYKVMAAFTHADIQGLHETEVKVYTLRTNLWRRIGDFLYCAPLYCPGTIVNGSFHWAAISSSDSWVIVSLDLSKETYGEVVQPNYGPGSFLLSLCVSQGCLCVLCNFRGTLADVWVMKEYGRKESWTKLFSMSYPTYLRKHVDSTPFYISKNGEILLTIGLQLVVYNPKDGTFTNHAIHNLKAYQANIYVESLVSPLTNNVVERQHQ